MSLTYVIPDLHGRADLLDQAISRIVEHADAKSGTHVLLGDYVNKGPDSRGVIERLILGPPSRFVYVALKGNHDALMVDALHDPSQVNSWVEKGGAATIASYGNITSIPPAHIDWLDARPLLYDDAHRIYVHAGVDPALPLAMQSEIVLPAKRYAKSETGIWRASCRPWARQSDRWSAPA